MAEEGFEVVDERLPGGRLRVPDAKTKEEAVAAARAFLANQVTDIPNRSSLPGAALTMIGQGLSFGFSDEAAAAARAGIQSPFSERTFNEIFDEQLAIEKENIRAAQEEFPVTSFLGTLAGGVAQGGALANFASRVLSNVPNIFRLAGLGAFEGGLFGAGTAEEGERLSGAATGAAVGAVGAPIVSGAATIAGRGLKAIGAPFVRAALSTPRRQAERVVREALDFDNLGPLDVANELARLGPRATVADLSESTRSLGQAIVGKSGPARNIARHFLDQRQAGQRNSLLRAAGADFDLNDFRRSFNQFINGRIREADDLYTQAYRSPLDLSSPEMRAILSRPSVATAFRRAEKVLQDEGGRRGNVRLIQATKEVLDDKIGAALRGGRNNEARRLLNNKNAMLDIVDSQVPAYRQARELFSGEASLRDAAEMGRNIFSTRADLAGIEVASEAMTQGERHAFRIGAIRGLVDRLDNASDTSNAAQRLIQSPRARDILRLMFPDEETFSNFLNTARNESQFSTTRNVMMGGSQTFQRLEAGRSFDRSTGLLGAITSGGDPIASTISVLRNIGAGDVPPETLVEVARILFSNRVPQRQLSRIAGERLLPQLPTVARQGAIAGGLGSQSPSIAGMILGDRGFLEDNQARNLLGR